MTRPAVRAFLTLALVAVLPLAPGGCSNFRSSRSVDTAPFAEHTIAMVADISYGLNRRHAVHLRKYLDDPAVEAYEAGWDSVRTVLRGIAAYSLAIVTVSKSDLSEQEKVEQLADFLTQLRKPAKGAPDVDYPLRRARLDAILADIGNQETFLAGLGAAQPIVDWVAWYTGARLDSLETAVHGIENGILQRVEDDYAGAVEFDEVIRNRQVMTLRSALLLGRHRESGDPELIAELRERDPGLIPYLPAGNRLTPAEIERAEDRIEWRLDRYREVQKLLATDIAAYNDMVRELDDLVASNSALLMKTRATIWIWSRAHARLAAGITDPAKIDIMGIAKKAMDAALPY